MYVDPLNVVGKVEYDNRITKMEVHGYNPYSNASFENSDEIRIPIQQQDLVLLPCKSYLYIEGEIKKGPRLEGAGDADYVSLDNNCAAFMFDEIRYELNGIEIDRCKNVGVTSGIKNMISLTRNESKALVNAGWDVTEMYKNRNHFSFCVPLKMLLGFCEDYERVIVNAKHELVLIRARDDVNPVISSVKFGDSTLKVERIQWRMPHVTLDELTKLNFLRIVEQDKFLTMPFRSWDMYEYPLLPETQRHTWAVKASTQLEKPRYVVFALRTGKKNKQQEQFSLMFNNCKLIDVKLYLNSECYPYDRMNIDFDKKRFAILFDMYSNFIKNYYAGMKGTAPLLTMSDFTTYGPFIVIDCSHQIESIKSGSVDIKLEFEFKENVPANTSAYCLIIHDKIAEYSPLTNIVRKLG